jgi:hypothetical protein
VRLLLVAVVVAGFSASCQHAENRELNRKIASSALVGTWVVTPTGIEGLQFAGHRTHLVASEHEIELRPGGRCRYQSFRDVMDARGDDEGYVASECNWDLQDREQQSLHIRLDVDKSDVVFRLAEEKGQLLLWQYAGDPDAWRYFEFAKRPPSGQPTP